MAAPGTGREIAVQRRTSALWSCPCASVITAITGDRGGALGIETSLISSSSSSTSLYQHSQLSLSVAPECCCTSVRSLKLYCPPQFDRIAQVPDIPDTYCTHAGGQCRVAGTVSDAALASGSRGGCGRANAAAAAGAAAGAYVGAHRPRPLLPSCLRVKLQTKPSEAHSAGLTEFEATTLHCCCPGVMTASARVRPQSRCK